MKQVYCHYVKRWIDMGRSRTRCPRCGATTATPAHPMRDKS